MGKFRYKRGIPLDYELQGYIYFISRRYKRLPLGKRKQIDAICVKAGGMHADALREFVTTDCGAAEVCTRFFLSQSTLERIVRRYYLTFAEEM